MPNIHLGWAALAFVALSPLSGARAGDERAGSEPPRVKEGTSRRPRSGASVLPREITPQLRSAVARGFDYLIRNQEKHGSFAGSDEFEVAVDALGGLAFLAGGHTERVGPYTGAMRRCVQSVLSFQNDRGYFDDGESRMYGHGFATLFLAELYGMSGDEDEKVRGALKRAVEVIEGSQSRDGGWDYQPHIRFGGSGSKGESDSSITVCQAMALRAARNLGIQVSADVVSRARQYIRKAQNPDGGFCYRLGGEHRWGRDSQFPRSAAGVCILYSLAGRPEEYDSKEIRLGYDYLIENYNSGFNRFPFYSHYYCAQAMFQAGGKYWATYFPHMRDWLLSNQRSDGSWVSLGMEVTPQATAMALIALQVPFRFLPITER